MCLERLQKRDRQGEKSVPLSYLIELGTQYKKYLKQMSRVCEVVLLENNDKTIDTAISRIISHCGNALR